MPRRSSALGQAGMVWMLVGLSVAVLLVFALFSFQRLNAIQTNSRAVLADAAHAAVSLGTCDRSGSGDRQWIDPAAAETAFVETFSDVTHLTPTGIESPTQSPVSPIRAAGLGLIQPTCSLTTPSGTSSDGGAPAEYVLTYPAADPYLTPITVTLAVYERNQVGQPLLSDPSLRAQQPGVFALLEGETLYTLAELRVEPMALRAAVFARVTGSPPALLHP